MKLTFEFPRLVCAKKNRYRFERGKMRLDAKALKDRKALAYAAVLEVFKLKRNPVFIDDDFRLEVIHLGLPGRRGSYSPDLLCFDGGESLGRELLAEGLVILLPELAHGILVLRVPELQEGYPLSELGFGWLLPFHPGDRCAPKDGLEEEEDRQPCQEDRSHQDTHAAPPIRVICLR